MTQPLTFAFPVMSDRATRAPHTVPLDEQLLELEEELAHREATYPDQVRQHRMSKEEAARHIGIWRRLIAELRCSLLYQVDDTPPAAIAAARQRLRQHEYSWADKVREIRRQLAIRRNAAEKAIASHRTDPATAALRLERLDALHWHYWISLDPVCLSPEFADLDVEAYRPIFRGLVAIREHWLVAAAVGGDRAATAWLATWPDAGRTRLTHPAAADHRAQAIHALIQLRPDLAPVDERIAA